MRVTSCLTTSLFQRRVNGAPLWRLPALEPYRNFILTSFRHDFNFGFLKIKCLLFTALNLERRNQPEASPLPECRDVAPIAVCLKDEFPLPSKPFSFLTARKTTWWMLKRQLVDTTATREGNSEERYENLLCRPWACSLKKSPLDRNNRWIDTCHAYLKIQHCCKTVL